MDVVDCHVKLRGEPFHTVARREVTCAEVAVLRHIHGEDAVVNIKRTGSTKKERRKIRELLENRYGGRVIEELWGKGAQQVDNLPRKLKDIGIDPHSPLITELQRKAAPSEDSEKIEDLDFDEDFEEDEERVSA